MPEQDWLLESMKTIRNLAEVAVILREKGFSVIPCSMLATILELLFEHCQQLILEHCTWEVENV